MGFAGDAVTGPTKKIAAFGLIGEIDEYICRFNIAGMDSLARAASDVMDGYKWAVDQEVKDLLALKLIEKVGVTWHLTKKAARIFWPERIMQ